jgi:hypothetical protein
MICDNRTNTRRPLLWQARPPAIVVNNGVLLRGIYRLESEPKSDDIDCWDALHDCDTRLFGNRRLSLRR